MTGRATLGNEVIALPLRSFAWTNLPTGLLTELARDLDLDDLDPAAALRGQYSMKPSDDLVLDAWETIRERWLVRDSDALGAVIDELWQPGQANGYKRPSSAKDQIEWLRRRNNTARLRAVVLEQFIAAGEHAAAVAASVPTPNEATPFSISTLTDRISEVEGFQVVVSENPARPALLGRPAAYPFERAARGHWNVARWRQLRFWDNYPDLDVQVLDAQGQSVHGRTLLSTVRAKYEQAEFALWPRTQCPPRAPAGLPT